MDDWALGQLKVYQHLSGAATCLIKITTNNYYLLVVTQVNMPAYWATKELTELHLGTLYKSLIVIALNGGQPESTGTSLPPLILGACVSLIVTGYVLASLTMVPAFEQRYYAFK